MVSKPKNQDDIKALVSMINEALQQVGSVGVEIIRSTQGNPAVGLFVTLLLTDVALKQGLLSPGSATIIKTALAAEAGITITSELLTAIEEFVPTIGTKTTTASILTPTVTTLVNAPVDAASAAELGRK
jgi:hypothetical protein